MTFETFIYGTFLASVALLALTLIMKYVVRPMQRKHRIETQMYTAARCKHKTTIAGALDTTLPSNGKRIRIECEAPITEDGVPLYCHDCVSEMIIPCAWCGEAILPGDPITLYSPVKEDFRPKKGARVFWKDMQAGQEDRWEILHNQKKLPEHVSFVGCLRRNCAESGADRAGFWDPPGLVFRVPTAYELMLAGQDTVITSDVGDQEEAIRQIEKHAELTSSKS